MRNADELEQEIEKVLGTQPTAYWVERLDAAGIPGGPVYSFDQILNDPHIKARKMVVDIDHPKIGPMKTLGLPIKSTGALTEIRKPAPWLGQHTEEVLREIGYGPGEVQRLFEERVVMDRDRSPRQGA